MYISTPEQKIVSEFSQNFWRMTDREVYRAPWDVGIGLGDL